MGKPIRITNVSVIEKDESLRLLGRVANSSLGDIQVDDYQRDPLGGLHAEELKEATAAGANIPPGVASCRGENYKVEKNGDHLLSDAVFIVDGLQRLTAAKAVLADGGDPCFLIEIIFGMNKEAEKDLFETLNKNRVKVSTNLLLRNKASRVPFIAMLLAAINDSTHPLHHRVTTTQRAVQGELLSFVSLIKVLVALHSHMGVPKGNDLGEILVRFQELMDKVGKRVLQDNVRAFFDFFEWAWGIKTITYKEGATWMRPNFLRCIAELFSRYHNHTNIWDGNRLRLDPKVQARLKSFNIHDPEINRLATAGGMARETLMVHLTNHLQSGRGARVLKGRPPMNSSAVSK